MEGQDGQMAITIEPNSIETAQEAVGRLDVHVCGECHTVFHFVEEFVEHKSKPGVCPKTSHFRENSNNEQKAQVWAFLLWKDSQIRQEGAERDAATSWDLYQQWCKMEDNVRNSWVSAGKTIQAFTKLSNAKIPDSPRPQPSSQQSPSTNESATKQTTMIRKVMRNGQPEDIEVKKEPKSDQIIQNEAVKKPVRPRCVVIPKYKPGTSPTENEPENTQEYPVEKITAKRYNTKKKCTEFLLKWEGFAQEQNTWETQEVVETCKYLIEEFERNLAKQKEMKALREKQQQQQQSGKKIIRQVVQQSPVIKQEPSKAGPSTSEGQHRGPGRPPRSSKTKAMDQVKVWCGSMKDEENDLLGKRRVDYTDSDSEEAVVAKRIKADTHSDEDWTGESEEEKTGRSDAIQRAFKAATNGSNNKTILSNTGTTTTVATSGTTTMVTTTDLSNLINAQTGTIIQQSPIVVTNQKGVKIDGNKMPQLSSGVYMMHRKDGMIKLESSPSGKINVKNPQNSSGVLMVQNRDGTTLVRKQVIGTAAAAAANSITPVKVVSKPDGTQVVTPMKYIAKTGTPRAHQITTQQRIITQQKNEPVKIQPKPELGQVQQLQLVTAVQSPVQLQTRMSTTPTIRQTNPQIQRTTPDGRQIVQRQAIRGQTPTTTTTSVLGNTRTTTVRTPLTKQQALSPTIQGQQRQQILQQKRIITTTTTTTTSSPGGATATSPQVVKETLMSPNQAGQARAKFTIVSSSAAQMAKQQSPTTSVTTITKQGQKLTPKTALQTQSLLSPQQKLLMAKRKAQAEAANASKMSPKTVTTQNKIITTTPISSAATRGRGRPPSSTQHQIISTAATISPVVPKTKETKIVESDGIHMEFHEVGGTDDENDDNDVSKSQTVDVQISIPDTNNQPDSPQPQYTLCPLTGRIIGPDGEPMETSDNTTIVITQEAVQQAGAVASTGVTSLSAAIAAATTTIAESSDSTTLVESKPSSLSLPTIDTTPSMPIIQTDVPATTTAAATSTSSIQPVVTTQSSTTAQIVLPSLDGSSENGTIMRVEMSPGTFLQSNDSTPMDISVGQDLPCLDDTVATTAGEILPTTTTSTTVNDTINKTVDTSVAIPITTTAAATTTSAVSATTATASTIATNDNANDAAGDKDTQKTNDDDNSGTTSVGVVADDGSNLVTITGEDGVVYQVAGQAADGQTLLVTRGADGEQQCVYVTTEQQGGEGGVLTLDHAVAEAVAQLMPDGQVGLAPQFYVKEGDDGSNSEQVVMSIMDTSGQPGQEDPDSQAQVVAQVVQADEPTPGGTRRVVLLLPDGNLMMTEVDEEQYAALELDK